MTCDFVLVNVPRAPCRFQDSWETTTCVVSSVSDREYVPLLIVIHLSRFSGAYWASIKLPATVTNKFLRKSVLPIMRAISSAWQPFGFPDIRIWERREADRPTMWAVRCLELWLGEFRCQVRDTKMLSLKRCHCKQDSDNVSRDEQRVRL